MSAPVPMAEENLIFAKERLDRIKAIADSLITLERNGYTDELCEGSVGHLMGAIEGLAEEAKALLRY